MQEMWCGMATYDHAEQLFAYNGGDGDLGQLVFVCITAGSEQTLRRLLAARSLDVAHEQVRDWLFAAARCGRASILEYLFEQYACGPSPLLAHGDWHSELMKNAFPENKDEALQHWTAYDFDPRHFQPVDHLATFRVLCETMNIPVPKGVVHAAIQHTDTQAIEYIHHHHHPVPAWTTTAWLTASLRSTTACASPRSRTTCGTTSAFPPSS